MTKAGKRARQDSPPFAASEARRGVTEDGLAQLPRCEEARPAGLEPATPGLEGRCSIQLSYGRTGLMLLNPWPQPVWGAA